MMVCFGKWYSDHAWSLTLLTQVCSWHWEKILKMFAVFDLHTLFEMYWASSVFCCVGIDFLFLDTHTQSFLYPVTTTHRPSISPDNSKWIDLTKEDSKNSQNPLGINLFKPQHLNFMMDIVLELPCAIYNLGDSYRASQRTSELITCLGPPWPSEGP